jgi:hypothetical protein
MMNIMGRDNGNSQVINNMIWIIIPILFFHKIKTVIFSIMGEANLLLIRKEKTSTNIEK